MSWLLVLPIILPIAVAVPVFLFRDARRLAQWLYARSAAPLDDESFS